MNPHIRKRLKKTCEPVDILRFSTPEKMESSNQVHLQRVVTSPHVRRFALCAVYMDPYCNELNESKKRKR